MSVTGRGRISLASGNLSSRCTHTGGPSRRPTGSLLRSHSRFSSSTLIGSDGLFATPPPSPPPPSPPLPPPSPPPPPATRVTKERDTTRAGRGESSCSGRRRSRQRRRSAFYGAGRTPDGRRNKERFRIISQVRRKFPKETPKDVSNQCGETGGINSTETVY